MDYEDEMLDGGGDDDDDDEEYNYSHDNVGKEILAEEDEEDEVSFKVFTSFAPAFLPPAAPAAPGQGEEMRRPEYLVTDNTSYYNLAAMCVILDSHVSHGESMEAIIGPRQNDQADFEW